MTTLPFVDVTASCSALFVAILLATFVSEDLACVAAGVLVSMGQLHWVAAVSAGFVGIVLGDLGVWLLGRTVGRGAVQWSWLRKRLPEARLAEFSNWLTRRGGAAVFASRFLPGTRVPLLLAAGVAGHGKPMFLLWVVLAALVWTPLFVLSVAFFGEAVPGWVVLTVAVGALLTVRVVPRLFTQIGRAKLVAKISKLWRWEFWPTWVFYLPMVPWFLWLAARYRSFTVWTAANPGIHAGGVVGESKSEILSQLPEEWIIPTLLLPAAEHAKRMKLFREAIAERGWEFPLILKPDAGQRGAGVKKVHNAVDAEKYLLVNPHPVIVQPFHPGPFEAGVFYFRIPGEDRGHIFSVTDKVFPVVTGDGRSTLRELIWAHPRYRMQAELFSVRHTSDIERVLANGEVFPLALAGNHCQGTLFRDGSHLITQELEVRFDTIAKQFHGFFIGRFDVRYASPEEFKAGRGFAIVELNGVTSESTNLYDPSWSLRRAYCTLACQWSLLFQIGYRNHLLGHRCVTLRELVSVLRAHSTGTVESLSD
jgi:membrane protein DedA with SNARE-associated domain